MLHGKLKTHLIVALTGAAVADGVGTLGLGYFADPLGNGGSCKGGPEQIFSLVNRSGFKGGPDVIFNKFLS